MATTPDGGDTLRRTLGVPGAVVLGLGSILGTGVFVGLGLAAGVAGEALLPAIALAALVALCNGLSSAALAAAHPVAGGTYAYGRRFLGPAAGFVAGWVFLCAKSASAATAALAVAGALGGTLGLDAPGAPTALGVTLALLVTWLVSRGLRRTNALNAALVTLSLIALGAFVAVAAGGPAAPPSAAPAGALDLLHGAALAFVAFTGYGRVATLGEEVREPARTIPRAVVATLAVTGVLYLAVAWAALRIGGAGGFAALAPGGAPLADLSLAAGRDSLASALVVAGALAMLGVLVNLVLGLSRIAFAMGRDGELPRALGALRADREPARAVWAVGALIAALCLLGDIRVTWELSAFTVLVYYGLTNVAALRLPGRGAPGRVASLAGLAGCLALGATVDARTALVGVLVIVAGLGARAVLRRAGAR